MRRLVIITVGKTHSGKSTFAKMLEEKLDNSLVMDQDNHAAFINTYYRKLQPMSGPNTLKHSISKVIIDYSMEYTDFHIIVSNSNRSKKGRKYLLEEIYPKEEFIQILVHFDIPDKVLYERITKSQRSTNIFRFASNFKEVLLRQQADSQKKDIVNPEKEEADYLFIIKDNEEVNSVIKEIINISKSS